MCNKSLVTFDLELKNKRFKRSNWEQIKDHYCRDLVGCLDKAIQQVSDELRKADLQRSPLSNYQGPVDTEKYNRNHLRLAHLKSLKIQAEHLKMTQTPGNTICKIMNTLNTTRVLWEDTTFMDRPLFVLKKIIAFFNPAKSAALFNGQYDRLKLVKEQVGSIGGKSFSR